MRWTASWAVALVAVVVLSQGCSRQKEDEYPKQVLDEFSKGCLETAKARLNGATGDASDELATSYCGCVAENMVKTIPFKEFQTLFKENGLMKDPGSDSAKKLVAVVTACQEKIRKEMEARQGKPGQ